MQQVRHLLFLALLCTSTACWSASLTAKVKLKLISPTNVTQDKAVEFGIVDMTIGKQCKLTAATGDLSGSACQTGQVEKPSIHINGDKDLAVSVSVFEIESTSGLAFKPTLYNGKNDHTNFTLEEDVHQINLGGEMLIVNAKNNQNPDLKFEVEVIYP